MLKTKEPMLNKLLTLFLTVIVASVCRGQACTELGQNPGTAFPVCGTQTFKQSKVKICGNTPVPGPCPGEDLTDKNPYWYKFTCYGAGTLGFIITPENLNDDYDWQLFDITGRSPGEVYTNKDLFVSCNWSGEPGKTGASTAGNSHAICGGFGLPLWSKMPTLIEGHEYLLLISHFTDSQSGYSLEFTGGTANITNPKIAAMERITANCKGTEVRIRMNKLQQCSSLAPDGSDFTLGPGFPAVTAARAPHCTSGFDMDSVVLTLASALPAGNYSLNVKTGTDGNTLLDECGNPMAPATVPFTVHQDVAADFLYTIREGCSADTVDFSHDGSNNTNTWNWAFDDNVAASTPQVRRVFPGGGQRVARLIVSNAHCSDTSTTTLQLSAKLNADFTTQDFLCASDPAVFTDMSTGNVGSWHWNFGNGATSMQQHPEPFRFQRTAGEKTYDITLQVSSANGCSDTRTKTVTVVGNCYIVVPSAFTPNGDGKNDYLYATNAFNTTNLVFRVYNRYGQMLFETRDWQRKWDGTFNGQPQASGTYVWTLSYNLRTNGRPYSLRGTTTLIR